MWLGFCLLSWWWWGGCHGGGGGGCCVGCETYPRMGFTVFVVVLWARFMVVVKGCRGGGDG